MKNILCPVDFTSASVNGLRYAFETANKINANVIAFHAIRPIPYGTGEGIFPEYIFDTEEKVKERLRAICSDMFNFNDYNVNYSIVTKYGTVEECILIVAEENDVDLIIMGTKGAEGIEALLGTVSAEIAEDASCPVLIVPENYQYADIKSIVYATDLQGREEYSINYIVNLARIFDAHIAFLNIQKEDHEDVEHMISDGVNMLEQTDYSKMSFHVLEKDDKIKGINYFAKCHNADLIVMATEKQNLLQKLFTHSLTKEEAYKTRVPLLAMHKEKAYQS